LCVYIAQYQDFSAPNLVLQFSKSREMEEESVLKDLLPFLNAGGHGSARAQPAAAQAPNTNISLAVAAYDPTRIFQSKQTCCHKNVLSNCVALEARYSGFTYC
jgi:hypothetical protein